MQYSTAPMVALIVSAIIHIFVSYLIVSKWNMGVSGLGLATMVTYLANYIFITVYAWSIHDIREALEWPSQSAFKNWSGYLRISLPSVGMLLAEGGAFQIMGILAGLISITDQAVNTIIISILAIMFMVPMGISSAACALVGE